METIQRGKGPATYSLGDMMPLKLGAGADTRRRLGSRRVHPEGLLDGGHEVRQAGGGLHVDLVFALEGAPDLVDKGIIYVAVLLQPEVEGQAGHGGGRRLAAGRDDRGRVHEDVDVVIPWLAVARLLEHVGHEVSPVVGALAQRLAGHSLLIGKAAVVGLHLQVLGRGAKVLEKRAHERVLCTDAEQPTAQKGLEDAQNPGMVLAAVEAVEAVRKGEVADDVKGEEVVPRDDVEDLSSCGLLAQL